jgi:hypothetical protein
MLHLARHKAQHGHLATAALCKVYVDIQQEAIFQIWKRDVDCGATKKNSGKKLKDKKTSIMVHYTIRLHVQIG